MIHARCEVLSSKRTGEYHSITLVAPGIVDRARPGQFLQIAVPEGRDVFLRRPFFIHQASSRGGWAGTLEFVVDPRRPGSRWLAGVGAHQSLDVIGPLGRGFSLPRRPTNCLLVATGYRAAPLYFLAQQLRSRGARVDMLIGARTRERVFKPIDAKRLSQSVSIVTEDASLGERGPVSSLVPGMADRCASRVIYAAGPRDLLLSVAQFCASRSIPAQVLVEERMACGIGVCWTCVVPLAGRDGRGYERVRSCVEGPVLDPARVVWAEWFGHGRRRAPAPTSESAPAER